MQLDRFTIKSQEAIQAALRLAEERRNPQATPEHLLAVLLEQQDGIVVAGALRKLGADPAGPAARARAWTRCSADAREAPEERQRPFRAELVQVLRAAEHRDAPAPATSTSRPSTCCCRSPATTRPLAMRCATRARLRP